MKKDKHPQYQEVLFVDSSSGFKFVCGSTAKSDQHETFEGKKYPVISLSISSSSHPFYVGGKQIIDTEGRVERFTKKYQAATAKRPVQKEEPLVEATKTASKKTSKK